MLHRRGTRGPLSAFRAAREQTPVSFTRFAMDGFVAPTRRGAVGRDRADECDRLIDRELCPCVADGFVLFLKGLTDAFLAAFRAGLDARCEADPERKAHRLDHAKQARSEIWLAAAHGQFGAAARDHADQCGAGAVLVLDQRGSVAG